MSVLTDEILALARRWDGGEEALKRVLAHNPKTDVLQFLGKRRMSEFFWVNHYSFLISKGYKLRPRFDPEWVPSWISSPGRNIHYLDCEDSVSLTVHSHLNDATSIGEGMQVVLKQVDLWDDEFRIATYFSKISDPRNHCAPVLDVFGFPEADPQNRRNAFLLMPKLLRFNILPFCTIGEFVEAMRQYVEGLQFMHEQRIAHRDACTYNLMMDGSKIIPAGFDFVYPLPIVKGLYEKFSWHTRRSVGPNKYYLIDFGLSRYYPEGVDVEYQIGAIGQDRSVPEFALPLNPYPYNPFKLDIYQLGNSFRKLSAQYDGVEPFLPVLESMTSQFPEDRPELLDVLSYFDTFTSEMLERAVKLRSPFWLEKCCIPES